MLGLSQIGRKMMSRGAATRASTIRLVVTLQQRHERHADSMNTNKSIRRCFLSSKDDGVSNNNNKISNTSSNTTITTTKGPIVGQLKNPIVAKLWAARQEAKQRQKITATTTTTTTDTNVPSKTPSESETSISYPFSTDEFLKETYKSPWGQMRFGKILEDLDALAGNIAFHHVVQGNVMIVTAAVDAIRLRERPSMECDQHLSGKVTWVGTSSMEIRMACTDDDHNEWLEAYFTFVTLDPITKKPVRVPTLIPTTAQEKADFELGARKAKAKKTARQNRLQVGQPLTEATLQLDRLAAELLQQAGPLKNMPSLADPTFFLMSQTKTQNAMIAQPQVRNLSDRIFGGFLMRRAFELAFASCYLFGGARPLFLEVDEISFESPVNVGDLLVFNSQVVYTKPQGGYLGDYHYAESHEGMPLVMMEVEAWVTIPEEADARVSNTFYFTFALPKGTPCRHVLPANIDEARRMATRMVADQEESGTVMNE